MTRLGEVLFKKSVNKEKVSRRTGLNASRISELSLNPSTKLRAELAIDSEPSEILKEISGHLTLAR